MNAAEHYFEAEMLLRESEATVEKIRDAHYRDDYSAADDFGKKAMGIWAQAQVHATLALAAATDPTITAAPE